MKLWLSPEVLSWNTDVLDPRTFQGSDFLKPYELLKHAEKRLAEVDDRGNLDQENHVLGEVVYHLRRAIEHREKHLDKIFNLSELPFEEFTSKKKTRTEERLYKLGVIKPILRSKLNRLRNIITHEQKDPFGKDKSEIIELYEFTWYFIRSTDSFLAREISGIIFYPPDFSIPKPFNDDQVRSESYEYNGCFLVKISPKHNWQMHFQGYGVPINLFSKNKKDSWLELAVNKIDAFVEDEDPTPDEIAAGLKAGLLRMFEDASLTDDVMNTEREKTFDKYLSTGKAIENLEGTLIGPPAWVEVMIETYFELYMHY